MSAFGGLDGALAVAGVFGTGLYLLHSIKQIYLRRLDAKRYAVPAMDIATAQRLERIEQAVDAIALEMERVSEGQRFTTKLLTERAAGAVARELR